MAQKGILTLALAATVLAACVRPDRGPSPFDALATNEAKERPIPASPVVGPDFIIIPDSELVYGPTAIEFPLERIISESAGIINQYTGTVGEEELIAGAIIARISREYAVHPRLLLMLLEYRAGWLTDPAGRGEREYPILPGDTARSGLYRQLSWAADTLNYGYYSRRVGGLKRITLRDGTQVDLSQQTTDATAAVQYLLGQLLEYPEWELAVSPLGLYAQYLKWFGSPQELAVEILPPDGLTQPAMRLPFEGGWFFTGGPHSAWGSGAAWAALDFAPDGRDAWGCYDSPEMVLAVADGLILRAGDGAVLQDLDGDGNEGTGWTVLYMHIAERGRVETWTYLHAGEAIGHPSCEGGPATGTHLHLARRFNGEWIPADQEIPFILDGWASSGDGVEYDGMLSREGATISASGFPDETNKVFP